MSRTRLVDLRRRGRPGQPWSVVRKPAAGKARRHAVPLGIGLPAALCPLPWPTRREGVVSMRSSPPGYRLLSLLVVLLAVGCVVAGLLLWPGRTPGPSANAGQRDPTKLVDATLTRAVTVPCQPDERVAGDAVCKDVTARRADDGRQVRLRAVDWTGDLLHAGQQVRLAVLEQAGQPPSYTLRDVGRGRPMLLLVALFVVVVVAFGRWQGVRSLVALGISAAVIVGFIVPAILAGRSPVPVALVGAMAIMLIALYLSHGPGPKTTAAAAGTALALLLTAAISAVFVSLTSLTGLASEEAQNANFELGGVSMRGLLLAGVIVGGLGVLDDVTVSQASLVFELFRANPAMRAAELVGGALRVGRDHVAATVNTIFLAEAALGGDGHAHGPRPPATALQAGGAAGPSGEAQEPPEGRVLYQLAGDLGMGTARAVWYVALEQLGPALSHATVPAPDAAVHASLGSLPRDVQQAVAEVARLAGADGAGGWYRRDERDSLRLDLREPTHLELLRRYGPYVPGTQVFAHDQAGPVLGTIAGEGGGVPLVLLRLDAGELERTRQAMARLGITAPLVPRRSRARGRRR